MLEVIGVGRVDVMALDAGVPPAFVLATRGRVGRLVLVESTLGRLPGAEDFFAGGPPWWFGFHQATGLAESVLVGHEAEYVEWFLRVGTADGAGCRGHRRTRFTSSYTGMESLRCGFEYYRAMPKAAEQLRRAAERGALDCPVMAIGAHPVGDALRRQLVPVAPRLTGHVIEGCGHIVPLDRPDALLALVSPFLDEPV